MRLTEFVASATSVQTATNYHTFKSPTWATKATMYLTVNVVGTDGSATLDADLLETMPQQTAAPVVAESVTGTTSVFEVQTITMTGEPNGGGMRVGVTGSGTSTVYTTSYMPLNDIKARPALITKYLGEAGLASPNDIAWTVALGTGATTPTVFTATFGGVFYLPTWDQTAIAVTGDRLYRNDYITSSFADWNGITQIAATGTTYHVIRISPGETGGTDDDTAVVYKLNSQVPEWFTMKMTAASSASGAKTTYALYCSYSS